MYKRKIIEDENILFLKEQSTEKYKLYKDISLGLYYVFGVKENKTVEIGDRDESEPFILYGLGDEDLKEDLQQLFNKDESK